MFRHATQVRVVELIAGVEDGEHALVQDGEERVQGVVESHLPLAVVLLQFAEEVVEDVGVLEVDGAVRFAEHFVELLVRLGQQVAEEFCEGGGRQW